MSKAQLETNQKRGGFIRFLDVIERVGNKLPHPLTIFFILSIIVVACSAVFSNVSVTMDRLDIATGEIQTVEATVFNLATKDGIAYMFTSMVGNFTSFAPLGTVLVAMIGVGVAEYTGLLGSLIRKLVLATPKKLITLVVVFLGVMSSMASDVGYVVLVPLGAMIFLSFGKHPIAGIAAAFAGVSGGFSANLAIGSLDALLQGLTQEAAAIAVDGYAVSVACNWYFMIASTILITLVGTYVTERIVEPKLGKYTGDAKVEIEDVTESEKKGMRYAGIGLLIYVIIIGIMIIPSNGALRGPEGAIIDGSPFMSSLVPLITFMFFVPAVAYGFGAGTMKNDKDVEKAMSATMATMASYITLAFVMSQFVAYFNTSNLGTILAVKGADFLEAIGLSGLPLLLGFIVIAGFINLFMGSASAKWAILAPVFVPILYHMGISPEGTQLAYRIGDSITNIISPLMTYFAIVVAFAARYDKKAGIGTLIATMLPYTIFFFIAWSALLSVWYMLGLPIGPGAFIGM